MESECLQNISVVYLQTCLSSTAIQELLAYSTAGLITSFLHCYPFSTSLGRSAIQEGAGGKTQVNKSRHFVCWWTETIQNTRLEESSCFHSYTIAWSPCLKWVLSTPEAIADDRQKSNFVFILKCLNLGISPWEMHSNKYKHAWHWLINSSEMWPILFYFAQ